MTTSSPSSINVILSVDEEADDCVALFSMKCTLMSGILKWAEHYAMLVAATASESSSTIIFSVKI